MASNSTPAQRSGRCVRRDLDAWAWSAYGVTYSSWLFSVGLAALFAAQIVILKGAKLGAAGVSAMIQQIVMTLIAVPRQATMLYRPVEVCGALAAIASPAALNLAGAIGGKVWFW